MGDSEPRVIPLSEVAQHASPKDAWMAIDGRVYDVSAFLDEHPGGPEIMLEHSGKDATKDFDDIGHSKSARDMMRKYLVGVLPEGEGVRSTKAKPSEKGISAHSEDSSVATYAIYAVPLLLLAGVLYYQFGQ